MKTKSLLRMLSMLICILSFASCQKSNAEEEFPQVTGYEEYSLTVASKKLFGTIFIAPDYDLMETYAVKKVDSDQWKPLNNIKGFDYETGYEYTLRISETHYLDYRISEPAWTEYKLLEVLSKEKKNSEGLPEHFISETYNGKYDIHTSYAIEAEQKELIDNDLNANLSMIQNSACSFNASCTLWILMDTENHILKQGTIEKRSKDSVKFPDSYRLLPPEGQVADYMEWTFLSDENTQTFDTFIIQDGLYYQFVFYEDLTEYYQNKYPEAGVRTVVTAHTLSLRKNK